MGLQGGFTGILNVKYPIEARQTAAPSASAAAAVDVWAGAILAWEARQSPKGNWMAF